MKSYRIWVREFGLPGKVMGIFRARTARGAIQQCARDLHHFPDVIEVRAELVAN